MFFWMIAKGMNASLSQTRKKWYRFFVVNFQPEKLESYPFWGIHKLRHIYLTSFMNVPLPCRVLFDWEKLTRWWLFWHYFKSGTFFTKRELCLHLYHNRSLVFTSWDNHTIRKWLIERRYFLLQINTKILNYYISKMCKVVWYVHINLKACSSQVTFYNWNT